MIDNSEFVLIRLFWFKNKTYYCQNLLVRRSKKRVLNKKTARVNQLIQMPNVKTLVVLIPALNEERMIAPVIKAIPREIQGIARVLVLVVNDGSTDKTAEKARLAGADKIVSHQSNKGLGVAFKTGIDTALKMGADVIVNIDADGQFNPLDIPKVIEPVVSEKADMVTCSRFKDKALEPKMPFIKKFGNNLFRKMINFVMKSNFTDTQCGFRAYSKEAALKLNLFAKFTYTQETLIDLLNRGMKIEEVACKVRGQREGKSRVVKHWYSYGIKALLIVIRSYRDYKPLQFFGGIGILFGSVGIIYGLLQWINSMTPGVDIPFWRIIVVALLILVGALMIVLALIADMLDRQRKIQEETLYRIKKKELGKQS